MKKSWETWYSLLCNATNLYSFGAPGRSGENHENSWTLQLRKQLQICISAGHQIISLSTSPVCSIHDRFVNYKIPCTLGSSFYSQKKTLSQSKYPSALCKKRENNSTKLSNSVIFRNLILTWLWTSPKSSYLNQTLFCKFPSALWCSPNTLDKQSFECMHSFARR